MPDIRPLQRVVKSSPSSAVQFVAVGVPRGRAVVVRERYPSCDRSVRCVVAAPRTAPRCRVEEEQLLSQGKRSVGAATVLFGVGLLLVLRSSQLLGLGPLLFDWEFVQLGRLAVEVDAGSTAISDLWRSPSRYIYMPHAQGTLLPIGGAAMLSSLFGASIWALHATSVLPEALSLGLLLTLVWRRTGSTGFVALVGLGWMMAPRLAVIWQLYPFGNHTEFLWVPLATALSLDFAPASRRGQVGLGLLQVLVIALGFVAYRGNLVTVGTFGLALLLCRGWRGIGHGLRILFPSLVLALGLIYSLTDPAAWTHLEHVRGVLIGAPQVDPSDWSSRPGRLGRLLPAAPTDSRLRWPYLGLLVFGGMLSLASLLRRGPWSSKREEGASDKPDLALVFLALWPITAALMTMAGDARHSQYVLQPFFACLVLALLAPALHLPHRGLRRLGVGVVVGMTLLGGADNAELIRPSAWERNSSYEGLMLWGQFQLHSVDEDDLPYWNLLASREELDNSVGYGVPPSGRCSAGLRDGGPVPSPDEPSSRCGCWGPGELAKHIELRQVDAPQIHLDQLGMGAWIACNRDPIALESALEGLAPELRVQVLSGRSAFD